MATNNESNSSLWFLIGAVVIAVAAIIWYLNSGGDAPAGTDTNVSVETTAPAAPAADGTAPAAPADGAASSTSTTTTTTAPATN